MMVKATFDVLSESDKQLVLETEPVKLKALDEDGLLDLHDRVRRARNKHSKLYRREAAAQVEADRTRGRASATSRRNAARAEVLEEALSRVSRALAASAKASADALKKERLELARSTQASTGGSTPARPTTAKVPARSTRAKRPTRTPMSKKTRASAKAAGKRTQAKRDSR